MFRRSSCHLEKLLLFHPLPEYAFKFIMTRVRVLHQVAAPRCIDWFSLSTLLLCAGIREGALLMVLANSNKTVQQAIESSADDPLLRGIEEELALTARRRRATGSAPKLVSGKYTFQKYYALPAQLLPGAYPPPQKALELLHRLASDVGIVGVMQQQQCASLHA